MLLSLLIGALWVPAALGFSFTFDRDPSQCGVVNVRWEGGSPPFRLTIIPAFDYPANITLPESTWTVSSQSGSYAWTVNYPAGTQFTALMSDSTGTGTGGVSPLYRVAAAEGSSACTLRAEENDFLFYLNATSVNQCDMVNVYWDDTAVDPVVILGVIPGGQIFQLWSATDSNSLLWNTNIAAGTEFILAAFNNGPRGTGGSSQLFTVGSGNNYCLSEDSPSSTTGTRTSTRTGTNTGAVRTITAITTARPAGAAGLSTGAIVGIAISAVVVVLALQAALLWFCCRRQLMALISHRRQMKEERQVKPGSVDLLADPEHEGGDHPTSLHEAQRRHSLANRLSLTSRSRGGETLANRSSTDDTLDMQSISPFWDTHSPVTRNSGLGNGPFESPPEDADLALPPVAPFGRQDRGHSRDSSLGTYSISSNQPLTLSTDVSPFPSMNFSPVSSDLATLQVHNTSHPRLPDVGNQPQTKAQMAAALSTANPDRVPSPGSSQPRNNQAAGFGPRLPRHEAPSGGFRRHEDAGRIPLDDEDDEDSPQDREPPPEVEELPPLYKPEWESESNGRNSGLGLGTTGSTASLGMSSRLPPGAAPR